MNRLETEKINYMTAFICICFCVVTIFIAIMTAINLAGKTQGFSAAVYMLVPFLFLAVIIILFSREGKKTNLFGFILFMLAFLMKSLFAIAVNTQPESDFYMMYHAAENLAKGVNIMDCSYFHNWPYQSAFVAWMAFFIKLFHADILFFKLMNCIFSALTNLLIYKIARRFASERGARVAGIVFMLYPGTFILIPVLTNQHLSEFLMLSAAYVYTIPTESTKKGIALCAAAAVLLALSNAIRPVGILMVMAVLACLVIRVISWIKDRRNKLKPPAIRAAALIAVYLLSSFGLSGLVKVTGLNEFGLSNNVPEWKFIVGLNDKYDGIYNMEDEQAVFGDGVDQKAAIEELMRERFSISPSRFLNLVYRKSHIIWGSFEPTWWAFTDNVYAEEGNMGRLGSLNSINGRIVRFTSGLYIWINILIAAGAFPLRGKRIHEAYILLMILALAYFGVHIFIEVQTRYRSLMTMATFPLVAVGVDTLFMVTERIRPRIRQITGRAGRR